GHRCATEVHRAAPARRGGAPAASIRGAVIVLALVLLGVFFGSALLIVAAYTLINRRRLVASDMLRARLAPVGPAVTSEQSILKDQRTSQLEFLNRMLEGKSAAGSISNLLERAG